MRTAKTPVAILNMHYTGLGIARNLAGLGAPVFGLSSEAGFPGDRTRHARYLTSPDSRSQPEALVDFLLKLAADQLQPMLLFPTRDHDIFFLEKFRAHLEPAFIIPFAGGGVLENALNKDRLFEVAEACGLAHPRSFTLYGWEDLQALQTDLPFPAIVKPVYASQWKRPGIWEAVGRQKVVRLESLAAFKEFYARVAPLDPLLSVQEVIEGPDRNLAIFGSYAGHGGEVRAFFTARKLLQYPALYGTGVVVEGLIIPEIVEPSRRLIKALGLQGVSEIEYKWHAGKKEYQLIEINPRHWDQHRLATAVGVNLTEAAYRDFTGMGGRRQTQAPENVRWIAEKEFAMVMARALRKREYPLGYLLSLWRGRKVFSIWDSRDLAPGWAVLLGLAQESLAWLGAGLRARWDGGRP